VVPNHARQSLHDLTEAFADDIDDSPTLAEVLELLEYGLCSGGQDFEEVVGSARLEAKLTGNRKYRPEKESRIAELNDAAFTEASDLVAALIVDGASTVEEVTAALLPLLQAERFNDIDGARISTLTVRVAKRAPKPEPGDVLAIPLPDGRFRVAVVLNRNRWGTAIGLLRGAFSTARAGIEPTDGVVGYVYTEDTTIADGTWRVVGHDDRLRRLFPSEPEIFHRAPSVVPGIDLGEFGAGESPDGTLRFLTENEAREIGLLDRSYRQAHTSEYLDEVLRAEDPAWT
jgi:hypothetical protein